MKLYNGRFARLDTPDKIKAPSVVNFYYFSTIPVIQEKINDVVFPINEKFETYYNCSINQIIEHKESGDIAIIAFTPKLHEKPIFEGEVYVNLQNFKVIRMTGTINTNLGLSFKDSSFSAENTKYTFDITFNNEHKNYNLFNSIKVNLTFDLNHNNIKSPVLVKSILVAYDYDQVEIKKRNKKVKNNRNLINDIRKNEYDLEFWKNHPIIKRTRVEDSIINVFEKENLFQSSLN